MSAIFVENNQNRINDYLFEIGFQAILHLIFAMEIFLILTIRRRTADYKIWKFH